MNQIEMLSEIREGRRMAIDRPKISSQRVTGRTTYHPMRTSPYSLAGAQDDGAG